MEANTPPEGRAAIEEGLRSVLGGLGAVLPQSPLPSPVPVRNGNRGAPAGQLVVSLDAFEEKLQGLGLRVEDRVGKGSRAQVFRCVVTGSADSSLGLRKGEAVAVKALLGACPLAPWRRQRTWRAPAGKPSAAGAGLVPLQRPPGGAACVQDFGGS